MTREEKTALIAEVSQTLTQASAFYLVDLGPLNAEDTVAFRRRLYEKGLRVRLVKNTLLAKALERAQVPDWRTLEQALRGSTALIVCGADPKVPAQVVQAFQKDKQKDFPAFKAAYVEGSFYIGPSQLEALTRLKSKQELLGEIVARLQSPAQQVVAALQSAGQTLAGLLQTLAERKS
ncbi:MAG: 50S ribosomal protein L10 [Bacteroidetes bacterium]|nr:MAG: 50S ribosomal protein L10 [Bacteroidota bacterium]